MSLYTVTSIPLAAIPGVHNGTGTFQSSNWVVVPSSVPGTNSLTFQGKWVQVTTRLFAISDNVVPNWFGVAIPNGIEDFTKAHIFFHPMPFQAGYVDADYFAKTGPKKGPVWPDLFYYMERLGYQLDGAGRNQIIIMPFLTNAATDTGIFAANWFDIVTDILTALRSEFGRDDGSALAISQIAVSSFSVGIVYSHFFRLNAPHLDLMTEVWDFDGLYSSWASYSQQLVSTARYQGIKYDQNPGSGAANFHVPIQRWHDYVVRPKTSDDVHGLIRDFMFLHAASISNVGGIIAGGLGAGTVTTGGTGANGGTLSTSGTQGTAGTSTTGATSGTLGTGGTGGTAGSGGTQGTTGTATTGGTSGTGGTQSTAGTSATGATSDTHGTGDTGGTAGSGGTQGTTGTGSMGGTDGTSTAAGGSGGTQGTAGAGTAGTSGASGGTGGTAITDGTGTVPSRAPAPGPPLLASPPQAPFAPPPPAPGPVTPRQPAPAFPAPATPPAPARFPTPPPPRAQVQNTCCCAAVRGMVAAVGTTATTAITSINAIGAIVESWKKR